MRLMSMAKILVQSIHDQCTVTYLLGDMRILCREVILEHLFTSPGQKLQSHGLLFRNLKFLIQCL